MDLTHIAYCGVDCAACADYESGKCPDCRHSRWPDEDPCMPIACCQQKGIDFYPGRRRVERDHRRLRVPEMTDEPAL